MSSLLHILQMKARIGKELSYLRRDCPVFGWFFFSSIGKQDDFQLPCGLQMQINPSCFVCETVFLKEVQYLLGVEL